MTISQINFTVPFFELQVPKAVIEGVLAGHIVATVTYCVTKMILTCSLKIGQFFDIMIVASSDKE